MPFEDDLSKAKENLKNVLGDKFQIYMENMKKWFKGKLTKENFDVETKKIISINSIHLHNEFLLCIIRKCHNFASIGTSYEDSLKENSDYLLYDETLLSSTQQQQILQKSAAKKMKLTEQPLKQQTFMPVDILKCIPKSIDMSYELSKMQTKANLLKSLEFCSREHTLPYVHMIHNRLLLTILELNIDYIDLNCIYLIAESCIYLLKNILTKLVDHHKLTQHKFQIKDKNQVKHHQEERIFARNFYYNHYEEEMDKENEEEEEEEAKDLELLKTYALTSVNKIDDFINLYELKDVLENERNLIPSHVIYTTNMEKIISKLHHPTASVDDTSQNDTE